MGVLEPVSKGLRGWSKMGHFRAFRGLAHGGGVFSYGVCPSDSVAVLGPGRALTLSQKRGWSQPRVGGSAPGYFLYCYRLTSSPLLIASIIARSPATFLALSVMRSPLWLSPDLPWSCGPRRTSLLTLTGPPEEP